MPYFSFVPFTDKQWIQSVHNEIMCCSDYFSCACIALLVCFSMYNLYNVYIKPIIRMCGQKCAAPYMHAPVQYVLSLQAHYSDLMIFLHNNQ